MPAEDLVDAALIGLDQGEVVTIPPLQDGEEWNTWEAQRRAMSSHLLNVKPAPRYAKVCRRWEHFRTPLHRLPDAR